MPFAISEKGERNKLAEHIATITEPSADPKNPADQAQIERVKSVILEELKALPEKTAGAHVIAEGRVCGNIRQITIQTIGLEGKF